MKVSYIYEYIKEIEPTSILLAQFGIDISVAVQLDEFKTESLAFYSGNNIEPILNIDIDIKGLVIISDCFKDKIEKGPFLLVKNPKRTFLVLYNIIKRNLVSNIHKSSVISGLATIGKNVSIGPNTVIGKCVIGNNVEIGSGVILSDNVSIGDGTKIYSNSVIGEPGLGSVLDYNENQIPFPHVGGVVIGERCIICSGTQINCGVFKNTTIGNYTHISTNCIIAHNVIIGSNVYVAAGAMIAGSVKIGNYSYLGTRSVIRDSIFIEEKSTIGIGVVLNKSILKKGMTIMNEIKLKNFNGLFGFRQ